MSFNLRRIAAMTLAALSLAAPMQVSAQAQAWPAKPVRIVIGYGPGSGADIEARFVSNYLEQTYKQPFLVEAKPGAGSIIGADVVAKSAPDGYTLFMSTAAPTTFPALVKEWHPTRNKGIGPYEFAADSNQPVWWQDASGREWQERIKDRVLKATTLRANGDAHPYG